MVRKEPPRLFCWLIFAMFLFSLRAEGARSWQWIGPEGGSVQQIAPDRRNANVWFVVTEIDTHRHTGHLYRSTNAGADWTLIPLNRVVQVVVHPAVSDIFAITQSIDGTTSQLWKSSDGGRRFARQATLSFPLRRVILDPSNPTLMFGLGFPKWDLAISQDAGQNWLGVRSLPFLPGQIISGNCQIEGYTFNDAVFSPFYPRSAYVSGFVNAICGANTHDPEELDIGLLLSSGNSGRTWTVDERGDGASYFFRTDALYPQRVLAFSSYSIKTLTTQGWKLLSSPNNIYEIISIPQHSNELLALQGFGAVIRSIDGGLNWRVVPVSPDVTLNVIASLDDRSRGLFGGTEGGGLLYRNQEHGWVPMNHGFCESPLFEVDFAPPNSLFAFNNFSFQSQDLGRTWGNESLLLPSGPVPSYSVTVDPQDYHHLLALSGFHQTHLVVESTDSGKTWSTIASGGPFDLISFDPVHSNIVYYAGGQFERTVYKSTQGGRNPQLIPSLIPCCSSILSLTVDRFDDQVIYITTDSTVYKSTNGGQSVRKINSGLPPNEGCCSYYQSMVPLPQKDGYLMLADFEGVYRTLNGGESWEHIASHIGYKTKLVAADSVGKHFFAVPGLSESTDGGATWKNINSELGPEFVCPPNRSCAVVTDITDARFHPVFVATSLGVYRETQLTLEHDANHAPLKRDDRR